MKTRKSTKLFATVAAASIVLAACGGDDDTTGDDGTTEAEDTADVSSEDTSEDTSAEDTSDMSSEDTSDATSEDTAEPAPAGEGVSYGNAQEFSNYNNSLATSNSVKNTIVLTEVLPSAYGFEGPTGELALDEELMDAVNVVSEDPLVIEFVVNAAAAWSDGDPVDCDDFYFGWAAFNGVYKQLDDAGNPIVDPETESELPLFEVASTSGAEDIESVECSEDGKAMTASFSTPYSDWQSIFANLLPAHIIEQGSGVDDLVAAFEADDRAAVEAIADFFANGWTTNPGELMPEIMPSAGPLMIGSWEAGSSLTLVPNDAYWGTPATGPVTLRYIAEEAQAQALANGEINAMDPQPTPDLLAQLEGTSGVVIETGNQYTWEHFDMNLANEALANRDVREAFALCLPREQIIANLLQPLVPEAQVLNNRLIQEFESAYVDATDGAYNSVNLERAQELLDQSGVAQPVELRLGWFDNGGNQRRTDAVALTVESCNQIGFNVIDNGTDTFFDVELAASDYDVAMFAWAGSPLKSGVDQLYACGGGGNYNSYCNPEVDELIAQINATPDKQEQLDLSNQVDAILWEDLVTIPAYSFPGVAAWSDNLQNVIYNPSNNGLMWNASTWQAS